MSDYNNDIEKYVKGELTPEQMHALEKKALDDPFLADALDGAQQLSAQELTTDLQLLNAALNEKIGKSKNVWVWPMRIAAGLLLLGVSSYLIILINNRDRREKLAINKESDTAPAMERQELAPLADSVVGRENVVAEQPKKLSRTENKEAAPSAKPRSEPAAPLPNEQSLALADKPAEAKDEEEKAVVSEAEIMKDVPVEEPVAAAPSETAAPAGRQMFKNKAASDDQVLQSRSKSVDGNTVNTQGYIDKVARSIVRGKVTFSEDGTGLPGVNITVKGSNQGTVTDSQGNYILPLREPDASLTFSFIGFTSKEITATSEELNVQLDTDISELNEVEVVGYSGMHEGPLVPNPPPVMELASPAGGRKMFKQYLEQNLQYPKQAIDNQIEGKVIVQFSIGATGQLSDFRVIRGLGYGCDEEVIRLVKEGPKWAPTKRDDVAIRDKAKVRIKFSLNKKK